MSECTVCDGTGSVCEYHRDQPWRGLSARNDACQCGSGAPCPSCGVGERPMIPRELMAAGFASPQRQG